MDVYRILLGSSFDIKPSLVCFLGACRNMTSDNVPVRSDSVRCRDIFIFYFISSPPKVSQRQGQLKMFGFEIKRGIRDDRSEFQLHFLIFTSRFVK